MTINGPAPMLLGFFMNALSTSNVRFTLKRTDLKKKLKKKIDNIYKDKRMERPRYNGDVTRRQQRTWLNVSWCNRRSGIYLPMYMTK